MLIDSNLKKIALMTTGGTILQVLDPKTGLLVSDADTSIKSLFQKFPELVNCSPFEHIDFCNQDSRDATPEFWLSLAKKVLEISKQDNITGIIILHGTDTLEDTAFFLGQALSNISKPVVITGAMKASCYKEPDGPKNLALSFKFLENFNNNKTKIFTAFNNKIFFAEHTQKYKSTGVDAFDFEKNKYKNKNKNIDLLKIKSLARVDIIDSYPGYPVEILDQIFENKTLQKVEGLVLVGYGSGNISAELFGKVKELKLKHPKLKIVIESRVQSGPLKNIYGGAGGAASLVKIGSVLSPFNSAAKARIALMLEIAGEKQA